MENDVKDYKEFAKELLTSLVEVSSIEKGFNHETFEPTLVFRTHEDDEYVTIEIPTMRFFTLFSRDELKKLLKRYPDVIVAMGLQD